MKPICTDKECCYHGQPAASSCLCHGERKPVEQKTYSVSIKFTDGEWQRKAICDSEKQAEHLVLMDARMGTPDHPCFFGEVVSITSEVVA